MVVANAGNAQVVSRRPGRAARGPRAVLDDRSLATGLVAIQGPRSVDVLAPLTDVDLDALRYYAIAEGTSPASRPSSPGPATRARTASRSSSRSVAAAELWDALLEAVRGAGGLPVGLGARDTLRLEAGHAALRQRARPATNPFDAGLGRVVKLDKPGDFVGRAALEKVAADGPTRRLVGLIVRGSRDRPPRLSRPRRRAAHRRRDQRDASRRRSGADRDGLCRARRRRAGHHGRRRDPRSAGPRAGRAPAVLREGDGSPGERSPCVTPSGGASRSSHRPALHQ